MSILTTSTPRFLATAITVLSVPKSTPTTDIFDLCVSLILQALRIGQARPETYRREERVRQLQEKSYNGRQRVGARPKFESGEKDENKRSVARAEGFLHCRCLVFSLFDAAVSFTDLAYPPVSMLFQASSPHLM